MNNNLEELINALYDMIQDAKSVPLSSDKCIIERDKALDMLDDLSAQLPSELKQARTIVASRDELIVQARGESKNIIAAAKEEAKKLVEKENIYQQALEVSREMAEATKAELAQKEAEWQAEMDAKKERHEIGLNQATAVVQRYVAEAMEKSLAAIQESEDAIRQAMESISFIRGKFLEITGSKPSDNDYDL